jgi:YidC/Oxa1 family membrane protein insertase
VETRALIAFVLSIAILVGYQVLLAQRRPDPAEAPTIVSDTSGSTIEPRATDPAMAIPSTPEPGASPSATGPEVLTKVETDRYIAEVSSTGGRFKSFQLKQYRQHAAEDSPLLDMVNAGDVRPLGLYWTRRDGTVASDLGVSYTTTRAVDPDGASVVTLTGTATGGERLTKQIRMFDGSYVLRYDASVQAADYEPTIGVAWSRAIPENAGSYSGIEGPAAFVDGSLEAASAASLEEPATRRGVIEWVGYADHYFLAAYLPDSATAMRFSGVAGGGHGEATLWSDRPSKDVSYGLYVGPKKLPELRSVGHRLDESVDLGWFAFVARPLLELMILLTRFTGNYGWSILLLTAGVRLVFYPVNKRQAVAMKAMQRIQPEIKRLQEKYKDDRERLNRELMDAYRRHKVNPLAGCLPMLVQLPVFLGLYNALMQSIELRHAPFLGWITDLSAPDRLGAMQLPFVHPPGIPVLTLLMGGSMLVQQRMMPAAGDPTQQRMMMFMPVIFTVMFINFPSGLVLYWFASNVLSIAQQYMTNRSTN